MNTPPRLSAAPPENTLLHTLSSHKNWVYGVAVTADGKCAVSASNDKTLKVWDIQILSGDLTDGAKPEEFDKA